VLLVNDCGNPVTNAQVVVTFNNSDPPLALTATDTTSGIYSATWTPGNISPDLAILARATASGFPAASVQIAGQVTPNAAPLLAPNGTLNTYSIAPVLGAPVGAARL